MNPAILAALLPVVLSAAKAEAPAAIAAVEKAIADLGGLSAVEADMQALTANRQQLAYVLVTAAKSLSPADAENAISTLLAKLLTGSSLEQAIADTFTGELGDAIVAGMRGDLDRVSADADSIATTAAQAAKDAVGRNMRIVDELPPDTQPVPSIAIEDRKALLAAEGPQVKS